MVKTPGARAHSGRTRRGRKTHSARADTGTKEHPPPARSGQLKTSDSNESSSGEQALASELRKAPLASEQDLFK